jgi:hypothetical protein
MVDIVEPKILTWSLSVQHQLSANNSVEVRYLGNHAVSLPAQVRLNNASVFDSSFPGGGVTPLPTYFSASSVPTAVPTPVTTLATIKSFNNNPIGADGFGLFTVIPPLAMSNYHSGSVDVVHRVSRGLYIRGNYTLGKVLDDGTNELFTSRVNPRRAQDGLNIRTDYGRSALDFRNKFALALVYDIPNVSVNNAVARGFLHGWEWVTTYLAQSGQPVTALSGVDSNDNGDSAGDRTILNPNGVGRTGTPVNVVCNDAGAGGKTRIVASAAGCASNANVVGYVAADPTATYVQAGVGARANVGRDTISTPGLNVWNMSFLKTTKVTERFSIQFRVATYDTFNHPNPSIGLPTNNGTIDQNQNPNPLSTAYPFVTAGNLFLNNSAFNGGSRKLELGLKFLF